jgi:hypothetical protein
MAALAAAAVLLVIGIVVHLAAALLAFIALLVCATGGWYAVDPPVVFASRPGALRVRLPRGALQVSPAARTVKVLSGSTLAELGRVRSGPGLSLADQPPPAGSG